MILRLWKGRAAGDGAAAYRSHVTSTVFPHLQRLNGYIGGRLMERHLDDETEFLVITEWSSWDAIRAFAGDEPSRAVVEPAARRCLSAFDEHVDHFTLVHEDDRGRSTAKSEDR